MEWTITAWRITASGRGWSGFYRGKVTRVASGKITRIWITFRDDGKKWNRHRKMEADNLLNFWFFKKNEMQCTWKCQDNQLNLSKIFFRRIVWDKAGKGNWDMIRWFYKCQDKKFELVPVSNQKALKISEKENKMIRTVF